MLKFKYRWYVRNLIKSGKLDISREEALNITHENVKKYVML